MGTHPPPETLSTPAAPSAYDLARTFFASAVDLRTGELWERHTFARFKRFAAVYGSYPVPTLSRAFAAEQKRSRFDRRDAADSKKARGMGLAALQRTSRSLSTQAAAVMRALRTGVQPPDVLEYQVEYADGSTSKVLKTKMPATLTEKYAKLLLHRAGIYAAEESQREQAEQERIERVGYALVEQAEMLALVDASRAETPRVGRATIRGAVCPPQPSAPAGAAQAGLVDAVAVELLPGKRVSTAHPQDAHVSSALTPATDRHRAPVQAAAGHGPQPGSAGYSIDGVQYADRRIAWRVWDDALDHIIGEYATEAEALAIANQRSGPAPPQIAPLLSAAPVNDPFWEGIEEELAAFVPPPDGEPRIRGWWHGERLIQAEVVQERYAAEQRERRADAPLQQAKLALPTLPIDVWPACIWGWDDPPTEGRAQSATVR